MKNIIGNRIRDIRKSINLSGEEFGNRLNVSKTAVSNWENGNRIPDAEALSKIADLGDVSIDWIFGRTDIKNAKLYKYKIDNDEIEIAVDKDIYPDGLTLRQINEKLKIIKKMEDAGIGLIKPDEKKE